MVVLDGTTPFGQLTFAGQVIVLPGVESFVKNNVNDVVVAGVFVNGAKVAFPVKVAVTNVPLDKSIVGAVPVFPKA